MENEDDEKRRDTMGYYEMQVKGNEKQLVAVKCNQKGRTYERGNRRRKRMHGSSV